MTAKTIILILAATILAVLSCLFSGAEIGIYQLSRLRLRLGIERKRFLFLILDRVIKNAPDQLISILVGNNLTCYGITGIATCLLLDRMKENQSVELFVTVIIAPVIFVFFELIPKSIFFYRPDALMPYVAPILLLSQEVFTWTGLVPLFKKLSLYFTKLTGLAVYAKTTAAMSHPSYFKTIFQETSEECLLSPVQTDIIHRLTDISNLSIKTVMVPLSKVHAISVNTDKSALFCKLRESPFTRLPVYDNNIEDIIGFINVYDVLSDTERFVDLYAFVEPIRNLNADTSVFIAINIMQRENRKIVIVTKKTANSEEGKPVGIVTMKDLAEELFGELAEW